MPEETVHEIIRRSETNYLYGFTKLGLYVNWNMHIVLEKIDAYLNSKHTTGEQDSLGRDKPFFNIVSAATNIWYRATDIDRKDIRFVAKDNKSVILAFVANVILQNWMDENRLGVFLNLWGRALARYGSAIVKFVEKGGKLIPSVIPWQRYIADPVQFDALPHIEKFYMTPAQLRKNKQYDQDAVTDLINTRTTRKSLNRQPKDIMNDFIELYEVTGEMDSQLLKDEPNLAKDLQEAVYIMQKHIVSFVAAKKKGAWNDFTLYKGRLAKDQYMITHLIEEDGRTLSIGAVENLFDAQWMANHNVKNIKDTLDIASRLIFQTADTQFVNRNVLTAIETGDIFVHKENMPLNRVANDKPDITASQNFANMWMNVAQELTATPDAMRGNATAGVAYQTKITEVQQASNLFGLMTQNKGLAIEDMLRQFVIPFIKKQLKNKKQIVAILDQAGIQEIDTMYIPNEAISRYNKETKVKILNGEIPSPYQPEQAMLQIQQQMAQHGNKRYFVPDDADDKTWADIFSDFEWDSIRVEVTNENINKQAMLQTLSTVFQTIASNPYILQNPNAMQVFSAIMRETAAISPLQLSTSQILPIPIPRTLLRETINFKDLGQYPDAQVQMLGRAGIEVQPPQPPGQPPQPPPPPVDTGGGISK